MASEEVPVEEEEGAEELEVTVEVVPQTVNEIVYLSETDSLSVEAGNCLVHSEEEIENDGEEIYEIGTVDMAKLSHASLVLDESQSFVFLHPNVDVVDAGTVVITEKSNIIYTQDRSDRSPFTCTVCQKQCRSYAHLSAHRHFHNSDELKCKVCGELFKRAQALSHHFKMVHESPKFVCTICGCPFVQECALTMHYKKHEPKAFTCDICSAGYDSARELCNHKKTHCTTMLYACNKCDAEFASTSAVSLHLRHVHAKPKQTAPLTQQNLGVDVVCDAPTNNNSDKRFDENRKKGGKGGRGDVKTRTKKLLMRKKR